MGTFAPDTNCMMAVLLPEHPHHARAVHAINGRLDDGDSMVILAHTLLETYSSLTRLPPPSRVTASDATAGIDDTFVSKGQVFALDSGDYALMLSRLADEGVVGGPVYDAAIVACARKAGVTELLTFNEKHFRRFEGDGLAVVVP